MTTAAATRQFKINRWPQTDRELWSWMRAVWGVTIPRTRVCPNHSTPFNAFADAFFARSATAIWKASRGFGGKTHLLAALCLTEAVVLPAKVTILGGSGAQSLNIHHSSQELWHAPHAPKYLLAGAPTKFDTIFSTGAAIHAQMASQTSVRGAHPQRLRMDEIDEMDLDILNAAKGQPMRGRKGMQKGIETQTVMSSTHQHPDGTMTAMLNEASERGWPIYEWCWRETSNPIDGWLDADEIARKRTEVPQAMWDAEYDLQEPSFEGRAIDVDAVDACFDPTLGETDEDTWIGQPANHRLHVTGVDWAKERDLTVITTFDTQGPDNLWICVAWASMSRLPWPAMVGRAQTRLQHFPGWFSHDATGIGNVISDYFDPELKRANRHRWADIVLGGASRATIFSDYIAAIEDHKIRYPRIARAYREHKYVTMKDLFGSGHPPDSFVAGAVAWAMRGALSKGVPSVQGIHRDSNPWDLVARRT